MKTPSSYGSSRTNSIYIHGRALAVCFASHLGVVKPAFASLRPGGYLELQDCIVPFRSLDDSFRGSRLEDWERHLMAGSAALGKDWTRVAEYKRYLEDAGFEDVVKERFAWPLGTWARGEKMKMLGGFYRDDLFGLLEPFSIAVTMEGLGMSGDEVRGVLKGDRQEIMSDRIHVYTAV